MKQGRGIGLAAGAIDIFFGLILCHFLQLFLGYYFASRAVVTLRIGQPGTIWNGPIPWVMGMFGNYVYTIPFALFLIFLPEAIWGWTIGKKMLGLRVKGTLKQRALRFLIKTSGFWGMTLALVIGSWQLLVLFLGSGILSLLYLYSFPHNHERIIA